MTIHPTYPEDEGTITLVLRNNFGEATCDAQLTVVASERLQLQSLHDNALPHIENIESFAVGCVDHSVAAFNIHVICCQVHIGPLPTDRPEEFNSLEAPRIVQQLAGPTEAHQDDSVNFEARIGRRQLSQPHQQCNLLFSSCH